MPKYSFAVCRVSLYSEASWRCFCSQVQTDCVQRHLVPLHSPVFPLTGGLGSSAALGECTYHFQVKIDTPWTASKLMRPLQSWIVGRIRQSNLQQIQIRYRTNSIISTFLCSWYPGYYASNRGTFNYNSTELQLKVQPAQDKSLKQFWM